MLRALTLCRTVLALMVVDLVIIKIAAGQPISPPFHQCPPVGANTSCAVLIVVNPDSTITTLNDPTQGPFDTIEDTLVGVQNNSPNPVYSLTIRGAVSGLGIFDFDGDGICGVSP